MTRYFLDTNVYIRASREESAARALEAFEDVAFNRLDFAAGVWMELQAGVLSVEEQAGLDDLVAFYVESDRMLAPSARAFQQAGRVLQTLAAKEGLALARTPASLHHDALLASTSREHGRVLITDNGQDFARIQRYLSGFRFTAPYPK